MFQSATETCVKVGALLDYDPDLGRLLDEERRDAAHREVRVRTTLLDVGEWDAGQFAAVAPTHMGLLILEGVLARHVSLQDVVSTELLGEGDVIRPWGADDALDLLAVATRWNTLAPVRLAVLDARVAVTLGRYPEVSAVIVDRLVERSRRLAVTQAISQLTRVEDRLVALFWHLAQRWGRVAADGVVVPLALSHRLIGELVGARRPTVSTALSALARTEQICRRADGTWLLRGEPATTRTNVADVIRQRRTLMPSPPRAPRADIGVHDEPIPTNGVDAAWAVAVSLARK
jgi:hypothetical protein